MERPWGGDGNGMDGRKVEKRRRGVRRRRG
jgi:hypothetical protein